MERAGFLKDSPDGTFLHTVVSVFFFGAVAPALASLLFAFDLTKNDDISSNGFFISLWVGLVAATPPMLMRAFTTSAFAKAPYGMYNVYGWLYTCAVLGFESFVLRQIFDVAIVRGAKREIFSYPSSTTSITHETVNNFDHIPQILRR